MLGYNNENGTIIRNDDSYNYFAFATNYEYDVEQNSNIPTTKRAAFIAGNIDPDVNDESSSKLSITNTIASNKWLQNSDLDYLRNANFSHYFLFELRNSTSFSTALPRCEILFFSSEVISANVLS